MNALYDHDHEQEITLFAETNFRNQRKRFGIKTDDRRRHMYVLGKTGMGKSAMLENMVLSDIHAGHGVAYIDPHGDTAEKLLDYIPPRRMNDVVYFNPADMAFPVGFNILETVNEGQKHLVGSGLMGVFKKIWPDVWSPRMEYILLNCVLALLDYPGATLLGINRLLVDKDYRSRVVAKIRDPIVKTFWVAEFTSWSEKYATEAIAPVQNKVGQFLSAGIIRNIVAQVKSTIDPRKIMDEGKIFIVNLSKGKIGEDNMRLLGGMIVTKLQLAAMERVDMPESERKDFYLCVDEFQNFANESFASILSEARKYRLNLTVAHQYVEQLSEEVRDAVFGNVGTMIMFRVGAPDATFLETEFDPIFTPADLTNLAKYQIYLKLMVDGVSTQPFSANTLPPISTRTGSLEKVIAISRERYAEKRAVIEEKVLRWSGMEATPAGVAAGVAEAAAVGVAAEAPETGSVAYPVIQTEDEQQQAPASVEQAREQLGGVPASMTPGTAEYADAGRRALEGDTGTEEDGGEYLKISTERLAAIVKPPQQQQKKEKPKFKHTCTRCGKTWDMPIQLDVSRPMFCAECLPIVREERGTKGAIAKGGVDRTPPPTLGVTAVEEVPAAPRAAPVQAARLHATMQAVEDATPGSVPTAKSSKEQNRPRLVVTDTRTLNRLEEQEDEDASALLRDVEQTTGKTISRRKEDAVPPAPPKPPMATAIPVSLPAPAPMRRDPPRSATPRPPRSPRPAASGPRRDSTPRGNVRIVASSGSQGTRPEKPQASHRTLEEIFNDDEPPAAPAAHDNAPASTVFRPKPGERVRF